MPMASRAIASASASVNVRELQLSGMTALHLSHSHQHASELNIDIARLHAILYHATCRKLVRQIGGADHGRRDATVVENRAASRDSNPNALPAVSGAAIVATNVI